MNKPYKKENQLENFNLVCKKCKNKAYIIEREGMSCFDDGGSPGHIKIICKCGNEETLWL